MGKWAKKEGVQRQLSDGRRKVRQLSAIILLLLSWMLLFTGCKIEHMEGAQGTEMAYEVIARDDLPEEIAKLAQQEKEEEFHMTYTDGEDFYLMRGYGKQETGGYSVSVKSLVRTETAVIFETMLQGPEPGTKVSQEPSYPFLVIKTEKTGLPVKFQGS